MSKMLKRFGVDISSANGEVDFAALKAAGVEFVLIRCGYGNDDVSQDDGQFFENVRKAKAHGIPYGVYLYSYALSEADAYSEVRHALRLLGGIDKPAYGVWFDMEDADGYKASHGMPSNHTLREICGIFCREVEKAGYYTGIYAALSWLENQLNSPSLAQYDKWVAQWNVSCDYRAPFAIWQYTDKLVIGGTRFDGNWAYKDYPSLTGAKKEDEKMLSYEEFKKYMERYEKEQAAKPVSAWAKDEWEEAVAAGELDGTQPRAPLTREQYAVSRARQIKAEGGSAHD